ncbi:MAG TPA: FtsQ-type POTRA domain-containing protein [Acidimicrobiales bacterium]
MASEDQKTRTPAASSVAVDPRMRLRRIGVRREAGRRRLRRAALVLGAAAAVVGAVSLTRTTLLDVDRVAVTGAERTSAGAVRRAAGIELGEPLVSVDAGAVADRVEDLPWVATARVERSWPSTVRIEVREREPVASVQVTEASTAVVDADGWVLAVEGGGGPDTAAGGTAIVLTGVRGRVAEGERLDAGAREAVTLAVALAERVPGAVASVSTKLDAELADGGTVRFGSIEHLDDKVTATKTVLGDVDLACLEVLDVRVPGSPALTRHQRCS